jgi:Tfp pilus assembly protein PilZ
MQQIDEERRRAPRYRFVVPVQLKDGSIGHSLNMSTSGVFFKTDQSYTLGEMIHFSVVLQESIIQCQGTVVRVESMEGLFGIAVELEFYEFA